MAQSYCRLLRPKKLYIQNFGQNNKTLVPFVIFLQSYSSLSPKNPEKVVSHDQARTAAKCTTGTNNWKLLILTRVKFD